MSLKMHPGMYRALRVVFIVFGSAAGRYSLFCAFVLAMMVGTGPPVADYPLFTHLVSAEFYWLLACGLLIPVTAAFSNRHRVLSSSIGYLAIALGIIAFVYWRLADRNVGAPPVYQTQHVLGLAQLMSGWLVAAGISRLCLIGQDKTVPSEGTVL